MGEERVLVSSKQKNETLLRAREMKIKEKWNLFMDD
jgi:hypothetical protein